jgi:hypothetical protein
MTADDLDGVVGVAQLSFPDHPEERACFANRLELHPEGCFVLAAKDGPVMGYLVAYPWVRNAAPALNVLIDAIPTEAEVVYLHDLALHPDTEQPSSLELGSLKPKTLMRIEVKFTSIPFL